MRPAGDFPQFGFLFPSVLQHRALTLLLGRLEKHLTQDTTCATYPQKTRRERGPTGTT